MKNDVLHIARDVTRVKWVKVHDLDARAWNQVVAQATATARERNCMCTEKFVRRVWVKEKINFILTDNRGKNSLLRMKK